MSFIYAIWNNIVTHFENQEVYPALIFAVLSVVTVLSLYEFIVYKAVLHRALYNKAFNICITVIPYFIATIILCLQSNMVITLGTIGALAIIRFRTAVKDPVDMIFLLWSIHIGITCGCQLYSLSIVTSIIVTLILIMLNYSNFSSKSHVLVIHIKDLSVQKSIEEQIRKCSRKYRIKSRNVSEKGVNLVFEIMTRDADKLVQELASTKAIEQFSMMEYDPDDII